MQFINQLTNKIFWGFLILALLVGGYVFLVRNLVKPPQISGTDTPLDQKSQNSLTNSNNADSDHILPAIAQPEDVVLEVPKKLERGGILKVYINNDGNQYPDPLEYSPSKVLKTEGLALISNQPRTNQFQEASGFFLVNKSGNYNFLVNIPSTWRRNNLKSAYLRLKIDGFALASPSGGKVYLEKGWHKISFFTSYAIKGEYPTVSWGAEGETAKPLAVWRDVADSPN